jgi:hypothetical protein
LVEEPLPAVLSQIISESKGIAFSVLPLCGIQDQTGNNPVKQQFTHDQRLQFAAPEA